MKYVLPLFCLLSASAFAADYKVTVTGDDQKIDIRFSTVKLFTSTCTLHVNALALVTKTATQPAKIAINAAKPTDAFCLAAAGHHSGRLEIDRAERGEGLPKLPDGDYLLTINGSEEGTVRVRDSVELK